jgi:hypothetical protein
LKITEESTEPLQANNTYSCPHCATPIEFDAQTSGLDAQCPHCSQGVRLPLISSQPASGSATPHLDNTISCPKCHLEVPFTREKAGTEEACPLCKESLHFPEFNDDLLGVEEDRFLRLQADRRSTTTSHSHDLELTGWHGLAMLLMFPIFWLWFRTQDGINSPVWYALGNTLGIGVAYVAIHGGIINGLRRKAMERRSGQIAAIIERTQLLMGGTLEGHVQLKLQEPLQDCSVGVSLELQASKNHILSSTDDPGEHVLSSCRTSNIVTSRRSLTPGSVIFPFSIVAPIHEPHSYDEKFVIFSPSTQELKFRKKTAAMDAETLLSTTALQWILHVELLGTDGVLLRSEKILTVDGARRS